jgi:hypothetical protein
MNSEEWAASASNPIPPAHGSETIERTAHCISEQHSQEIAHALFTMAMRCRWRRFSPVRKYSERPSPCAPLAALQAVFARFRDRRLYSPHRGRDAFILGSRRSLSLSRIGLSARGASTTGPSAIKTNPCA